MEASGDSLEQGPHVADVRDRDTDLAHLAARQNVIAVKPGLGRQIEGDRKPCLPLGQVLAIEPVQLVRRRMAGVSTKDPGLVAARCRRSSIRLRRNSLALRARGRPRAHPLIVQSTITENSMGRHSFARDRAAARRRKLAALDQFCLRLGRRKADTPGSALSDSACHHDRGQQTAGDCDDRQIRIVAGVRLEPPIAGAQSRIGANHRIKTVQYGPIP